MWGYHYPTLFPFHQGELNLCHLTLPHAKKNLSRKHIMFHTFYIIYSISGHSTFRRRVFLTWQYLSLIIPPSLDLYYWIWRRWIQHQRENMVQIIPFVFSTQKRIFHKYLLLHFIILAKHLSHIIFLRLNHFFVMEWWVFMII